MALTPRDRLFVAEYLIDFNGTQAAIRAGVPENIAAQTAYRMLMKVDVRSAIEERQEELAAAAGITVEWILRQWRQIAEADPNELIYTRLECCRHCYGENHDYQWTEPEYREAVNLSSFHVCGRGCKQPCKLMIPPPPRGGFGFDPRCAPVADCPQCNGEGVERVKVNDTRRAKGSARRLYAGVKQSKDGSIEIKMRDQDAALNNLAKYMGMLVDKKEITTPDGRPFNVRSVSAKDLTDDQLAAFIAQQSAVE